MKFIEIYRKYKKQKLAIQLISIIILLLCCTVRLLKLFFVLNDNFINICNILYIISTIIVWIFIFIDLKASKEFKKEYKKFQKEIEEKTKYIENRIK